MKTKKINNRTIIGIVCIVLALVVTFGVSPLVNRISDQKTDIVRIKNTIERGQQITANDLEIVRVGSYNLPDGIIKDGKSVVGKYATATLFAGDYLFSEKITGESNSAADILAALDGKKVAISVSIGSYADGLSGKLENGDIISIIIYNKEEYRSYIPAELRYVRVITTTTESGVDKDENIDDGKAITVTLLVTPEQAELLSQYESVTSMHFVLVYRGDKATADEYIKVQDDYLKANPVSEYNPGSDTEAENNE